LGGGLGAVLLGGALGAGLAEDLVAVLVWEGWAAAIVGMTVVDLYAAASIAAVKSIAARHRGHLAERFGCISSGNFSRLPHARHTRRTAMTGFLRTRRTTPYFALFPDCSAKLPSTGVVIRALACHGDAVEYSCSIFAA
jgi:hypothetical protein